MIKIIYHSIVLIFLVNQPSANVDERTNVSISFGPSVPLSEEEEAGSGERTDKEGGRERGREIWIYYTG